MQTFLQAVGLADSPRTVSKQASGPVGVNAIRSESGGEVEEPLVPDLTTVAAATEKNIILLEEKAKRLGHMKMQEACSLLAEWTQGLRRQPRTHEPLASFKASFLRSNALEKSLENLRHHKTIQVQSRLSSDMTTLLQLCLPKGAAALAKPLLQAITGEEVPLDCVTTLLIAIQMLKEDWQEVVWNQVIRLLEHQLHSIEYELDKAKAHCVDSSRGFELAGDRRIPTDHEQELSRDKVEVIASLCQVISKSRLQVQSRAKEVSTNLKQLGTDLSRWLDCPDVGEQELLRTPVPAASEDEEDTTATTPPNAVECYVNKNAEDQSSNAPNTGLPTSSLAPKPSSADCELAFESMMGKDTDGMRRGLQLLGFPDLPLRYEPNVELRLDGHDIRDVINRLLAHWSVGEVEEFHQALAAVKQNVHSSREGGSSLGLDSSISPLGDSQDAVIKERSERVDELKQERSCEYGIVDLDTSIEAMEAASEMPLDEDHQCRISDSSPGCAPLPNLDTPQLLAKRADIEEERQVIIERLKKDLDRLRLLDQKLMQVDASLGQHVPSELKCYESLGIAERIAGEFAYSFSSDSTEDYQSTSLGTSIAQSASLIGVSFTSPRSSKVALKELLDLLDSASAALELDFQRSVERLTTVLQQRRAKLLEAFRMFLSSGARLVDELAIGNAMRGGESMEVLWSNAQHLCILVDAAVDGRSSHSRISLQSPEIGARCLAKWAGDGAFYDAEVQSLGEDGTVVVNWLRPRPESLSDTSPSKKTPTRPMHTVTADGGGDDLCHRWVAQEDVHTLEVSDPDTVRSVQLFLRSLSSEDRQCVDCGSCEAEYASVSYGTFFCERCRIEVCQKELSFPLLRTSDAWSWSEDDLAYMRSGGNSEYTTALANYPTLVEAPIHIRYASRFAEYYRRRIELRVHGLPPPPSPSLEDAGIDVKQFPKEVPDVLCEPEARLYAVMELRTFERWACERRRKLPKPLGKMARGQLVAKTRPLTGKFGRQPLTVDGYGSAVPRPKKSERRSM